MPHVLQYDSASAGRSNMDRLILISLLVKLGVAAAVASTLARSREFQSLLYREERTLKQKIYLTIWIAIPFALGIVVRVVTPRFIAADLSVRSGDADWRDWRTLRRRAGRHPHRCSGCDSWRIAEPAIQCAVRADRGDVARCGERAGDDLVLFAVCRSELVPVGSQSPPTPEDRLAD